MNNHLVTDCLKRYLNQVKMGRYIYMVKLDKSVELRLSDIWSHLGFRSRQGLQTLKSCGHKDWFWWYAFVSMCLVQH